MFINIEFQNNNTKQISFKHKLKIYNDLVDLISVENFEEISKFLKINKIKSIVNERDMKMVRYEFLLSKNDDVFINMYDCYGIKKIYNIENDKLLSIKDMVDKNNDLTIRIKCNKRNYSFIDLEKLQDNNKKPKIDQN